jgi:predicted CoA-binding protein
VGGVQTKMRDINTEIDIVDAFIRDAQKYGLVNEVVYFALKYMKENPESSIEDAMNHGYYEWIK